MCGCGGEKGGTSLPCSGFYSWEQQLLSVLWPAGIPWGSRYFFFFNFILKLAYFLFLAVPGLHCCMQTFFSCGKQGPLSSCGTDASCCVGFCYCGARALGHLGFSSTGPWAQSLQGIWNLPGLGIKPVLPALAGEFLTTGPPGKPRYFLITGSSTPSLLSPSSFLSYISKQLGS